ncbi:hypothetical protein ACFYRC_21415 [Streptomyces sp. NPDC005279]
MFEYGSFNSSCIAE